MTNFELFKMSKYKLAYLLSVAEVGANDWPNELDKWVEWLDKEAEDPNSSCYTDYSIKKYLSNPSKLELDRFKDYLKSDQRKYTNNQLLELSYIGE